MHLDALEESARLDDKSKGLWLFGYNDKTETPQRQTAAEPAQTPSKCPFPSSSIRMRYKRGRTKRQSLPMNSYTHRTSQSMTKTQFFIHALSKKKNLNIERHRVSVLQNYRQCNKKVRGFFFLKNGYFS